MYKPVVALVGRPNVGKSTLFNRLAGERLAVVDEIPGTTRDRLFVETEWSGAVFDVIDTGGIDPTQTGTGEKGQPLSVGSADFIQEIRTQAGIAIREADTVIFITDAKNGVTPADQEIAQILRKQQVQLDGKKIPPVLLAVNKADNESLRMQAMQFYELGMGEPYPISSLHGTGTGDLLDEVIATFKKSGEEQSDSDVALAIVGKPNVGKSSLLNRLVGEERAIVSSIPGTTRDAVDTNIIFDETPITLIDTAGIRRKGKIDPGVEKYSVIRSLRAIERSDVGILILDATSGITAQDTHIAGYILESWKSVVVVVNKWDAIEKDTYTIEHFTQKIRYELNFMSYVPVLFISALTGQRANQVLPMALRVQKERMTRLSTSRLNRAIQLAQDKHPSPSRSGRQLRIYYGTQVRVDPPMFVLYVNDPTLAHFTYLRYLDNSIRKVHGFLGTPIRISLRPRR